MATERVTFDFEAQVDGYKADLDKAEQSTDNLERASVELDGVLGLLNSDFVALAGSIGLLVNKLNDVSSAMLTNSLNQGEIQANLELSDEETQKLIDSNTELGKTYLLTGREMSQVSAINSEYIHTAEGVSAANELVAQTADLYAIKEGNIKANTDQLITSQEALRDVILTGSTTAFEDSTVSLEAYRDALIETTGWSQQHIDTLTEESNGVFEYTEALSKAADPQQRFTALTIAMDEELQSAYDNMDEAGQTAYDYQKALIEVQNATRTLIGILAYHAQSMFLVAYETLKAKLQNEDFRQNIISLGKAILDTVQHVIAFIWVLIKLVAQIVATIVQSEVFMQALQFVADNLDLVAKAIILVVIAMVAYRAAMLIQMVVMGAYQAYLIITAEETWALVAATAAAVAEYLLWAGIIAAVVFIVYKLVQALYALVPILWDLATNVISFVIEKLEEMYAWLVESDTLFAKIALTLVNVVVPAFEFFIEVLTTAIDLLSIFFDTAGNVIGFVNGLFGGFSPFSAPVTFNSSTPSAGVNSVNNSSVNTFNIQTTKEMSFRQAKREARLFSNHPGLL